MTSEQSGTVTKLYQTWLAESAEDDPLQNPQQWDVLSSEPGGVDYVEIDAGGIPSMWATPKRGLGPGPGLHPRRRIRVRLDLHAPKDVRPPSQSRRHTAPS